MVVGSVEKPALIIGNGPSLNSFDPNCLDHVVSFGTNAIGQLFPKWGRETNNVIIFDHRRIAEAKSIYKEFKGNLYIGNIHYIYPPYKATFKHVGRDFIPLRQLTWPAQNFIDSILMRFRLHSKLNRYLLNRNEMSFDSSKGFFVSSSVIIPAIQLVASLGFKKILLTGVDANYPSKTSYATGIVSQQNPAPRMFDYNFRADIEPLLVKLQIYFESMGIDLIDCTPGGKLRFIKKGVLNMEIGIY